MDLINLQDDHDRERHLLHGENNRAAILLLSCWNATDERAPHLFVSSTSFIIFQQKELQANSRNIQQDCYQDKFAVELPFRSLENLPQKTHFLQNKEELRQGIKKI